MANLFYTEFAKNDLKKIWLHIAEQSETSADKFLLLSQSPKIGRAHDEFIVNLRSFLYKNHIIFYFPIENGIELSRILHGARDIEDLFDRYFSGLKP